MGFSEPMKAKKAENGVFKTFYKEKRVDGGGLLKVKR